jgi:hypothetical protein
MKFNNHQLKRIAEQMRLTSWAQGAILYSDLHIFSRNVTIILVFGIWIFFQISALFTERGLKDCETTNIGGV